MQMSMFEAFFEFVLEVIREFLNDWLFRSFTYIGALFKKVFKKKEFKDILKEPWNTRLGFLIIVVLLILFIFLFEQF